MQRVLAALILSCLAVLVAPSRAEQAPGLTIPAVVTDIERQLAAAQVPGAAFVVVLGDAVRVSAVGVADAESGARMTVETLVPIGSLTKLLTALSVTSTLQRRGIPLDRAVGTFMPGLSDRASAATFHQLLAQTSGLRDKPGDAGPVDEAALATAARALAPADFLLPGGTVFSYSNLGYMLAGATIEHIEKRPFADVMRDTVLKPLGMTRSAYRESDMRNVPRAVGHRAAKPGAAAAPLRTTVNDASLWPAGYLWSSGSDFAKVVAALVGHGRLDGRQALPGSLIEQATTPHVPMPNVFVGGHYGYGLMIARDRGVLFHEHGGTMPGYSAILRVAPEERFGFAILSNLDNAPLRRVAENVMRTAFGRMEASENAGPGTSEAPVSLDEMKRFLGRYENRGSAELAVRDGRVVLMLDDGPAWPVSRIADDRFLTRPQPAVRGPEFVLRPATAAAPAYLHFALWAYVRR